MVQIIDQRHADQALYRLYLETMGSRWPLSLERFMQTGHCHTLVATQHGRPQGFAVLDRQGRRGYLQLLAVRPAIQHQGLGTDLLQASERWLRAQGAEEIVVGQGRRYLWQGAPEESAGFFQARGYRSDETSVDMTLALDRFVHPAWGQEQIPRGIEIRIARPEDRSRLPEAFRDDDLADWLGFYMEAIRAQEYERILLAATPDQIVGVVLVETEGLTWQGCFEGRTGGLACLGVISSHRGQGIGRALAARGTWLLQQRGLNTSYLGWTWLVDWYGALGYRVWRRFAMLLKGIG